MFAKRSNQHSTIIENSELGALSFVEYDDTSGYTCRLKLPISFKEVDVFFDSTSKENMPTEMQKNFLNEIVVNYDRLLENSIPVISMAMAPSDLKEEINSKAQLQPVSIVIPKVDTGTFKWDMTFELTTSKNTFLIVYFEKFTTLSSIIEKDEHSPFTKFLLRILNGHN